jgi:hypothetical protein
MRPLWCGWHWPPPEFGAPDASADASSGGDGADLFFDPFDLAKNGVLSAASLAAMRSRPW